MPSRLERLFAYYSSDLERFAPEFGDHFACPLCCRVFERTADLSEIVAEEHPVSRRLGGRIVTLTCRECNSRDGAALDAHLIQRVRLEANKRPLRTRVTIGAVSFPAELYAQKNSEGLFNIVGIKDAWDPAHAPEARRLAEEGREPINLHIKFDYNPDRSVVALIRGAYLLMFRTFGYRYVLDESAAAVRRQLAQPLQHTPIRDGIMWRITDAVPAGSTVSILHTPASTESFFVIMTLDRDTKHVAGVTLPAPGTDGSNLYPLLKSVEGRGEKKADPLPIPKQGFLPLLAVWRHFTAHQKT